MLYWYTSLQIHKEDSVKKHTVMFMYILVILLNRNVYLLHVKIVPVAGVSLVDELIQYSWGVAEIAWKPFRRRNNLSTLSGEQRSKWGEPVMSRTPGNVTIWNKTWTSRL